MRSYVDKILERFLMFLMGVLVIDALWQVMSRYLLSSPSSFTDELAAILLIWVGLFGAAYLFGKNEHLAIDILLTSLEGKRKRALQLVIFVVVMLFAISVLIVGGGWLVYTRFYLDVMTPSLQINMGYVYLSLPLSGIVTLYYGISNSVELFNRR